MMLTHHGAHGKLKLFHLEDGGFNHQRDYKYYDALYYKGHSYYKLCKYDLALISFLEIPETYKNFDALHYINSISYDKAQLYYNKKKYTEAIVHFTRVSSSYNKYYDALYYKGHSYYKLHKYDCHCQSERDQ